MPFEILEVVCVESRTDARCLAEHSGNLFLVLCRCVLGLLLVPADSLCLLCFGHGTLSIFLLEFIIPKSQQKRRYVSSIDHTHHIRQEEYDGKEGQHDNGCAPVKMLIWSKHERQQQGKEKPCGCYDRAVFGKPFVDDGVIQEEELAHECYSCEQGEKGKYKAFRVCLHTEGNHGKHCQCYCRCQCLGQEHDKKSVFRAIHCRLDVGYYNSASVSDQ